MQRGAVLKLFNKLRLQRSLRTKNTGAAQLADIICVSATSLLHYTEAATDHELCCYYYITMEELVNPETDERLILCDTRVVQSGAQLLISHRKD